MIFAARKSLGQHFLNDKNIAKKIVQSITNIQPNDVIFEVGPGFGVLTQYLIENKDITLIPIEIDTNLYLELKKKFPIIQHTILNEDFLKFDISKYTTTPSIVIGNLPYYISSRILFKIFEQRNYVKQVVCMVQREVAERIASTHNNKSYGILSVLLQAFYDIEYLFSVNETVFNPRPKVKSAVIRMSRNAIKNLSCDEALFVKIVKTAFNQRRKTLRNSLKSIESKKNISHPYLDKRPEQLTVQDFIELTTCFEKTIFSF